MKQMQVTGIDSYFLHKSLFTILITLAQHLCSDFLLVYKNASYSQTRLCPHQMLPVRFFWTFIQIAPSFLLWPEAPTPHWCTGSEHQSTDCPYCSAPTFGFVLGYPVSPWYRYPTSLSILTSPEWKCQCSSLLCSWHPFLHLWACRDERAYRSPCYLPANGPGGPPLLCEG